MVCEESNVGEVGGWTDNVTWPPNTVKPFVSETTSLPVVTVTVLAPAVAVEPIEMVAVALVGELTVSEFTVMPLPKLASLVPCTQCVNWPISETEIFDWPCWPVFGLTCIRDEVPLVTVKPLVREMISLLVVTTTLLLPTVAVEPIEITAVALVAEFTVSEFTVMPLPKAAVVVPCTQCVN